MLRVIGGLVLVGAAIFGLAWFGGYVHFKASAGLTSKGQHQVNRGVDATTNQINSLRGGN